MTTRKRRSDRTGRTRLSSPGRPPVAGRDERRARWFAAWNPLLNRFSNTRVISYEFTPIGAITSPWVPSPP